MCIWDPRVAALPEKQRCPTAVFWLGWGPGIAVMSPCTPAHPPKWVRCAPRGIYISPTLQSLRLLLSRGKSALNQERTRMQCLTLLFICNDMAKTPAYLRSQMFHTVVYLFVTRCITALFICHTTPWVSTLFIWVPNIHSQGKSCWIRSRLSWQKYVESIINFWLDKIWHKSCINKSICLPIFQQCYPRSAIDCCFSQARVARWHRLHRSAP